MPLRSSNRPATKFPNNALFNSRKPKFFQTLTLTGTNNYGGTTTINAGPFNVGNGGTTGCLGIGAIVDNGSLVYHLVGDSTTASLPAAGVTGTGTLSVTANIAASAATTSGIRSAVIPVPLSTSGVVTVTENDTVPDDISVKFRLPTPWMVICS